MVHTSNTTDSPEFEKMWQKAIQDTQQSGNLYPDLTYRPPYRPAGCPHCDPRCPCCGRRLNWPSYPTITW